MRRGTLRYRESVLALMVAGLVGGTASGTAEAGIIEGVNHTHWAINWFSVDGRSGLDIIGPWQLGGGGHYSLPSKWQSGLTVRVDWETGVSGMSDLACEFPGFADESKYDAWRDKVVAARRQHTKDVLVPEYTSRELCGITIHFLPCDEIQVTTSCYGFGHPNYPIKTPLNLPEPQSCPNQGGKV